MFENELIKGIHMSRYVASWVNVGNGKCDWRFREWLTTLVIDGEHLTEEEVYKISNYATNGKLELESSAKWFRLTK